MKYIELAVKTAFTVHGYDEHNQEVIENSSEQDFVNKLILIDRIQSISEQYILVTSSHGRVMYWEYNCSMQELRDKLSNAGLIVR